VHCHLSASLEKPVSLAGLLGGLPAAERWVVRKALQELVNLGYVMSVFLPDNQQENKNRAYGYDVCLLGERDLLVVAEQAISRMNSDKDSVQMVEAACAATATGAREQLLEAAQSLIQTDRASDKVLLLVLAISGDELELCRRLGSTCASSGTPWALLRYSGWCFQVGPLILPGETACFDCMALRALAAAEDYAAEKEYIRYLSDPDRQQIKLDPPHGLLELAVFILANELEAHCEAYGGCGIRNGVWLVYSHPLRLRRHRLLKVPGCPTCAIGRNRLIKLAAGGCAE
jgi:bacteriocin biosynthesis cyclodehydratase domain-containing protein